ncbi:MAG: ribonuclease domain-containing protein [Casimicrobiaceae bacterium]
MIAIRARFATEFAASIALAAACLLQPVGVHARDPHDTTAEVALSKLPQEARDVLAQIRAGAPMRYQRDGVIFGNREHLLPAAAHGYYHEYTVRTPGARDRGARRIVCGGAQAHPLDCFYSDDHYASFRRVRE